MIIKGVISIINSPNSIRIVMPNMQNKVSYNLELSQHIDINSIHIGDTVIAAFYSKTDGVIIAKCQ